MLWQVSGQTARISVDYTVNEEFILPSEASALLMDGTGQTIATLLLETNVTQTVLAIPATSLELAAGEDYALRALVINFRDSETGQWHTKNLSFMVHTFVPLVVSASDVRSLLGLHAGELPDAEVDLLYAYFELKDAYGETFTSAFTDTAFRSLAANHCVVGNAALKLIPTLSLRALEKLASEDQTAQRFKVDFPALEDRIRAAYSDYLTVALRRETTAPTFVTVGAVTDAITG